MGEMGAYFWTNQPHVGLNSFILIGAALPPFSLQLCRHDCLWSCKFITLFFCTTGTPVTRVTATDADDPVYGNSAKLVYSILEGQPYFSVDPNSGKCRCLLVDTVEREALFQHEGTNVPVVVQAGVFLYERKSQTRSVCKQDSGKVKTLCK